MSALLHLDFELKGPGINDARNWQPCSRNGNAKLIPCHRMGRLQVRVRDPAQRQGSYHLMPHAPATTRRQPTTERPFSVVIKSAYDQTDLYVNRNIVTGGADTARRQS